MDRPVRPSGFTLVELIVTIAIAAIILTIGIPSFRTLIANSTVTSEVNQLVAYMHLARSEAIKRGRNAVLCATSDGQTCSKSIEWQHGFMVFADLNKNRTKDADDVILTVHQPKEKRIRILSAKSNYGRKTISYYPSGMSPGSTATIEFCDSEGIGTSKAVIVSNTGRPRVSDKRPDGAEITCN
ncbi:MAG: hypothetical protein C0631_00025 [Sedimenticola sp.]|jgi:type IV fimbrial biogenesis protein FimT|nr:MAG: hypothetical protein C0631_00025 [Sedimenticola sp.]